jgi:hypothetical protein
MSANPHANGGLLKKQLRLPDFHDYAVAVERPAAGSAENTRPLGAFLRDIMRLNPQLRVFGPGRPPRTSSTRSTKSAQAWLAGAPRRRRRSWPRCVVECSEHTLEDARGLPAGRHGCTGYGLPLHHR